MTVVPFPLDRRRGLIQRQARWFDEQSHAAAERNLRRQLDVQRQGLVRRGISPDIADREAAALERAIRAEIGRIQVRGWRA